MTADFTRWSKNGREGVLASATAFPVASMVAQLTGAVGIAAALLGVWSHFLDWLVILSVFVPPLGGILITDQVLLAKNLPGRREQSFRPTAFAAWAIGAMCAGIVRFQAPSLADAVVGLLAGGVAYAVLEIVTRSRQSEPAYSPRR